MRYIQKINAPDYFMNTAVNMQEWDNYLSANKKNIFKKEQNCLCVYYTSQINIGFSNLEYIEPKIKYPNIMFDYDNIVISCNGDYHNDNADNIEYHCGHRKANNFYEMKFLNSVEIINMREYFQYNSDGKIYFSNNNTDKIQYYD